jgi:hypothetical protein
MYITEECAAENMEKGYKKRNTHTLPASHTAIKHLTIATSIMNLSRTMGAGSQAN